ncbi:hypothetical protein BRD17_01620 [Halobacteriales archaeon SW_7_68_16]|nr:MAG: hypothetical protein BRD17_01620 [Halobacteriales archaeon SW_7_68_16]
MSSLRSTVARSIRRPLQNRRRALAKTALYRVFMIAITIAVALAVTGDVNAALNIGLVANAVKTAAYYLYERAWDRIAWGVDG